ncbi:related to regulatory protein RLR1 [Cephalotrichum gorgonifer]|uniref:THO complex subunit 2 n=1 Tax=Cephalotrichum gorgonifer TaxID=2041049 RepID=A0AAE8N3Y4_9PEZI|nr:related to regulatory protein RLR1 [Cephalotrichum gorgonifer]
MPPAKRKRNERASTDGGRPAPHRPGDTFLAQHDRDDSHMRQSPGRGGRPSRRNDRRDAHQAAQPRSQTPVVSSPTANRPAAPAQTRQQPPAPAAATARPIQAPSPPPTPVPSHYFYDILSDDRISNWAETGRQEVIQHGVQSRDDVDITELSCLFQEFTRSVLDGRLRAADAGACVKEIIGPESSEVIKDSFAFEPHMLFLDTVATVVDSDSPEEQHPYLAQFLDATGVSHQAMRETLEVPLLNQLGLIRDSFAKLGIRHATNLLYRQANYNLLREETEGYSKLITELFTSSSTSAPPTSEAAHATFEKIKALIGTFDLDVGRVLDVTLDVFAAVLIKQFRFFIKLLRVSSWWPRDHRPSSTVFAGGLPAWALPDSLQWQTTEEDEAATEQLKTQRDVLFWERARQIHIGAYFELGGRQLTDSEREALENAPDDGDDDSDPEVEHQWKKLTKTLPPQGNKTAAQLLGFKLRFYVSDARDADDVLPANLLYLAALLIKVGFISLCDLYPHLWPLDDDMEAVREKATKELEEKERASRPGGGMNALMMAGALPDDTQPSHMPAARSRDPTAKGAADSQGAKAKPLDEKPKLPEPMEQKIALVLCLLTIGALPEALFMLGRFPWMVEVSPDVLSRVHRILNHSINKVYKESQPVSTNPLECPTKDVASVDQTGAPKGTVKVTKLALRRPLRWPFPDKSDMNDNQHYRFYWDEWADNTPVCQTVDDVFTLCGTLLNISGVNIGKDETLIAKISSIGAMSLAQDDSQANRDRWLDLLKRLLVPSLSLTTANSATVNAVWALLKTYPTQVRYNVYAEWYEGQTSRLPAMKIAFSRTRLETISIMKRLSLTNLSEMAKSLAKTSYSSPGVVFKVALDQIESYANLIEAFVECAKYFTDLSYDVLLWSLMNSLGGNNRSRTQETSVLLTSKWLQALSRFAGKIFRRYTVVTPTPIIRYVDDQLFKGNSTDLIILKELISSMGGVVPTIDFTDDQIMAMSGGETLRRQTLIGVHDKRFDSVRSAQRLIAALVDSKLAGRLLVNLVQYRQAAIFKATDDEAHIKFLSSMVDDSHQILNQYLDLLRSNLDPATFDSLVPSIDHLLGDFGIEVGLAFLVSRPSLSHQLMSKEEQQSKSQPPKPSQDDGDVAMADSPSQSSQQPTPAPVEQNDKMQVDKKEAAPATPTQGGARMTDLFMEVLQPIIDTLEKIKEPSFWKAINPEFYAMFWTLQLGDLFVPEEWYQKEEDRAYTQSKEILRDRSDLSRPGMTKKEERHKALTEIVVNLAKEKTRHKKTFTRNKFYMIRRFKSWFPSSDQVKPKAVADAVLEQCLLPRLMLSASDAEYCHRVVRFLHDFACPNFKLMSLYDCLFNANRLRSIIFTCTVREAEYLGRFLKCVLTDLSRWHKDKAVYEKEALVGSQAGQKERSLPGFASAFDGDGKPTSFVEHDQFRDLLYGWHRNLNTALKSCLTGMEWMHIRNAITVLKSVLDIFPAVDFMAQQFTRQLKTISDREAATKPSATGEESASRVDLSVAAQSALSELQKRKSKWVMVQGFRPNISGEPQPDASPATSGLRANAPAFTPGDAAKASGKTQSAEDEDGEGYTSATTGLGKAGFSHRFPTPGR